MKFLPGRTLLGLPLEQMNMNEGNTDEFDVLVLRKGTHGIPIEQYAAALRERLTDRTVRLARTPAQERELIDDAEFVTGMLLSDDVLEAATNLEVFACAYAGTGHLPLDQLEERGVAVTNASGVHGPNIGEHVLGAILRFTRRFHVGQRQQDRREWRHYQAHELQGSTVTIVGLGAIGQAITERLEPFGVDTIGVRYTPEKGGPTDEVIGFDGDAFHEALARTDYLVLACPLTETTRGLVGREELLTIDPRQCWLTSRAGRSSTPMHCSRHFAGIRFAEPHST